MHIACQLACCFLKPFAQSVSVQSMCKDSPMSVFYKDFCLKDKTELCKYFF